MASGVLRWRPIVFVLFAIYLGVWPGSTVVVAFDRVPAWGAWMGGGLLILQGVLLGTWLIANHGWRRGALAAGTILVLGWAVEHLGVTTGFPFGSYGYTDALAPKLGGVVPLAIPFAWLLVVPTAIGVSERLLGKRGRKRLGRGYLLANIVVAASLALLLDMTIEPVAVHINRYWVWLHTGWYYGVPVSNFVAWWCTSVVIISAVLALLSGSLTAPRQPHQMLFSWLPLTLYLLNLLMFALVNAAHNQLLAATIAIVLLSALAGARVWSPRGLIAASIARTRRQTPG